MNRRRFLNAMGLAAGSLFLPSLTRFAHSASGQPPRRLIIIVSQHGAWMPSWAMNPAGNPEGALWQQELGSLAQTDFSPALAPLHPWRDRMVAIEGLSMVSGDIDPAGVLRHEIGQIHALTGDSVEMVSGLPIGRSPSIDQIVAGHIARPDRLRSLVLSVGGGSPVVNYRGPQQPLLGETNLQVVHDRLFGLVNGGNAGPAELQEQQSLLQGVQSRYEALTDRLSTEDQHKLEVHRDLVRDLNLQIAGMMEASCQAPQRTEATSYDADFSTMASMVTTAMSCDLLRVATLNLPTPAGEDFGYPGENIHDAYAHELPRSDRAVQVMADYYAWHSAQIAELLGMLDAIPEDGGTMLDHTMVLWTSELADGVHGFDQIPVLLFGGSCWSTGRYIHYPSDTPYPAWVWDGNRRTASGRPHQKLLSSVLRAFEVPDPKSGGDWNAMPIESLRTPDGADIDCTGVLEELFA